MKNNKLVEKSETLTHVEKNSDFRIVQPDQTYNGMTYSDLMSTWWNWVMGENPDYRNDDKMMFLRGNFTSIYKRTVDQVKENELSLGYDPMFINNRTGLRGITISTNTQLFFPVSNIHFVVTDRHEATELNTSYDCRVAARKEFSKGVCSVG